MTRKEAIKIITKSDGKKYSVRANRNRIFYPGEWFHFFGGLKESQKPLFDCLLNTGARINEVLHIEKKDIDFKENTIFLRVVKKRGIFSDGFPRKIKISSQYSNRLKKYVGSLSSERLFLISSQAVSQLFKRKLKKAKIKDWYNFSLHNIRKTTECWLNFLGNNHLLLLLHFGHNQSTSLRFYLNQDFYDSSYKFKARQILGDLYM